MCIKTKMMKFQGIGRNHKLYNWNVGVKNSYMQQMGLRYEKFDASVLFFKIWFSWPIGLVCIPNQFIRVRILCWHDVTCANLRFFFIVSIFFFKYGLHIMESLNNVLKEFSTWLDIAMQLIFENSYVLLKWQLFLVLVK